MKKYLYIVLLTANAAIAQSYRQVTSHYTGYIEVRSGCPLFFETRGDTLCVPLLATFTETMPPEKLKLLTTARSTDGTESYKPVTIKGAKGTNTTATCDDYDYTLDAILISDITPANSTVTIRDFISNGGKTLLQKKYDVTMEGFYTKRAGEGSAFQVLKNGRLQETRHFIGFDELLPDSLQFLAKANTTYTRGLYLKIKGQQKLGYLWGNEGRPYNKGMTIFNVEVIAADTTKTQSGFIADKIDRDGYYDYNTTKILPPETLQLNRSYNFTAQNGRYMWKINVTRTNLTTLTYTFARYRGKKLKKSYTGTLLLNFDLLTYYAQPNGYYEWYPLYESAYKVKGQAYPFGITVEADKNDKNKITGRFFDIYGYRLPIIQSAY